MKNTKKRFQKVIGEIRNDINKENGTSGNFPKPMMTVVQMEKREATVNCGGEWSTAEKTKEKADKVMSDKRFRDFLLDTGATAVVEMNNFKTYQIRIKF